MANTYSQIELHMVFAVKHRDAMLMDEWRDELFRYIGGIIKNRKEATAVCVGGWRDHVHILMGCRPSIKVSDLVKDIKLATNKWINHRHKCLFAWQDGYGVFSIAKPQERALRDYINRQPEHHQSEKMTEEYRRLLTLNGIDYDKRYIFHEPE